MIRAPKVVYLKPKRKPVPIPTPRPLHGSSIESGPPANRKASVELESPIVAAHAALRARLTEKHGSFWLDGTPASLDQVMRETNRLRREIGLHPVGKKREWLV